LQAREQQFDAPSTASLFVAYVYLPPFSRELIGGVAAALPALA
jgi:hypothetical protein